MEKNMETTIMENQMEKKYSTHSSTVATERRRHHNDSNPLVHSSRSHSKTTKPKTLRRCNFDFVVHWLFHVALHRRTL